MSEKKPGRPPNPDGPMSKAEYQQRYRDKKKVEGKKSGNAFYIDAETSELVTLLSEVLDRPKAEIMRMTFLRGLLAIAAVPEEMELADVKPVLMRMRDRDQASPEEKAYLDLAVKGFRVSYDLKVRVNTGISHAG